MAKEFWSSEHSLLAKELLDRGACEAEFWALLKRSKSSAYSHRYYLTKQKKAPRKLVRDDRQADIIGKIYHPDFEGFAHRPTAEMLKEADYRKNAPRSLTAWAFGDPPPGHSALDRKRLNHDGC